MCFFCCFKQKTAYELRISYWSSDVCSSDLDLSLPVGGGTVPHHVGVLAYAWSPDGQWLWYSLLKARPTSPRVRFDEEVSAMSNRRRSTTEAEVEFYLRGPDGHSIKVRSEEHTSELQSLMRTSYDVFCLKKK